MKKFRHMKIRSKMLASFLLVIALTMMLVVVCTTQVDGVSRWYNIILDHPVALRAALLEFKTEYRNLRRVGATIGMHAGTDNQGYEALYQEAGIAYNMSVGFLDNARQIVSTNPELQQQEKEARIARLYTLRSLFIDYYNKVTLPIIAASRTGDLRALRDIIGPAEVNASAVREMLNDLLVAATETKDMHIASVNQHVRWTLILLIAISAITAVIAVGIALYVARYISEPLAPLTRFMKNVATAGDIAFSPEDVKTIEKFGRNRDELGQIIVAASAFVRRVLDVGKMLERVSDGDLTAELPLLSGRDSMGLAFKKMIDNLNAMCGDISESSVQVATVASQVTAGAQSLSAGATEQAASIEELSVSIAEMAERTTDTAKMAEQAADLAASVKASAEQGRLRMNEMMEAVGAISEASQSIRKIITTIDAIAFQTNILAVNAAVEAAHAGKYGKGFSVVAAEVRSLAAKSAEAARETGKLIANSIEKAQLGVSIAEATSTSLGGIVSGINDNNLLVSEIARSSEEQSNNIAQINIGINQVSQVVQQNSATAEESAAASEEMAGQSTMLQKLVSQFRLKRDASADDMFFPPEVMR